MHKHYEQVNSQLTQNIAFKLKVPIEAETSSFNTYFCLLLANNILQEKGVENGSNTVISPFSFHLLLSLIAVGSNGRTLEQLFHCLGSKSLEEINSLASQMIDLASPFKESNGVSIGEPDLSFVNAAWVAQHLKLKPSFQEIVEGVYHAEKVVAEVNAWAETATRGLIRSLLTAEALKVVNEDTALILANALYFKETWAQLFDTSKTKQRVFHLLDGEKVHVPFMTSNRFERYLYNKFEDFKILKLPYKTKQLLQMFKSNPEYFNKRFDLVNEKISDFWVPRFKFEFEPPFNRRKAEITEMVDSVTGRLFVRKMFHKCFIEVNEEGTEAAASTAVMIEQQQQSVNPNPSFVADHPFMFMIKEEISGVVFFVGAVLNPSLDS
ncbi:hypothetical protein ES332_D11G067800v1 [Gossypium tomentosum]|uniref:Serpin domain-containing protein n=1 Tax=Gossypium tomentosum TaxID=34277 RepID=A0A5D2IJP5_GOSTO|nr:hypothetical protein ES332_D11G067800v1 [Gossypium tomentosum]